MDSTGNCENSQDILLSDRTICIDLGPEGILSLISMLAMGHHPPYF